MATPPTEIATTLFASLQRTKPENSVWHTNSVIRNQAKLQSIDKKLLANDNNKQQLPNYCSLYLQPLFEKAKLFYTIWDETFDAVPTTHSIAIRTDVRAALLSYTLYGTADRIKKSTCFNYSRIYKFKHHIQKFICHSTQQQKNLPFKRPSTVKEILTLISTIQNFKKFCSKNRKVSSAVDDHFKRAQTNKRSHSIKWDPRWFHISTDNDQIFEEGICLSMKSYVDCLQIIYAKQQKCKNFPVLQSELLSEHSVEWKETQIITDSDSSRKQKLRPQQQQPNLLHGIHQQQEQKHQNSKINFHTDPNYIHFIGKQAVTKQHTKMIQQEQIAESFIEIKKRMEQQIRQKVEKEYKELINQNKLQHTTALKQIREKNEEINKLQTQNSLLKRRLSGCTCSPPVRRRQRCTD